MRAPTSFVSPPVHYRAPGGRGGAWGSEGAARVSARVSPYAVLRKMPQRAGEGPVGGGPDVQVVHLLLVEVLQEQRPVLRLVGVHGVGVVPWRHTTTLRYRAGCCPLHHHSLLQRDTSYCSRSSGGVSGHKVGRCGKEAQYGTNISLKKRNYTVSVTPPAASSVVVGTVVGESFMWKSIRVTTTSE